jgi:hypothetical protein
MIDGPPRLPLCILSALGARAEFRDAVLGDIAEEYHVRAGMQGGHAARAWYVREACRAVPCLIRDGVRHLGVGGIAHVITAALKAYASIVVVGVVLFPLAKLLRHSTIMPVAVTAVVVGLTVSLLGGYLAARFGRRAPLLSSVALGVFWAVVYAAALLVLLERVTQLAVPTWYNIAGPAIILTGTALGGICRVARQRVL